LESVSIRIAEGEASCVQGFVEKDPSVLIHAELFQATMERVNIRDVYPRLEEAEMAVSGLLDIAFFDQFHAEAATRENADEVSPILGVNAVHFGESKHCLVPRRGSCDVTDTDREETRAGQ